MTNPLPVSTLEFNPPSLTPLEQQLLATFQAWVLQLISDPISKPSQVLNAMRRLEKMRDFPMRQEKQARTLALAEARVDLRRRSLALREALLQERLDKAAEKKARSIEKEESATKKTSPGKAAAPAGKAMAVAVHAKSAEKAENPGNDPSSGAGDIASARTAPQTTEQLQAMEWDLRSFFSFGDLRPFEFCIGSEIVRFPDRSTDLAKINYPVGFQSSGALSTRSDEYLILPHILPAGFATAKAAKPDSVVPRQRIAPVLKEGRPDWNHFLEPLCSGTWPDNTILTPDWKYGDSIPGMPEAV